MSQVKGHSNLRGLQLQHVPRIAAALLLLALVASGCARRLDLTPAELSRIEARDGDLKTIRVFPNKKLLSEYAQDEVAQTYEVNKRKVTERGAYRPLERIIARKTPGKVVARTELNGMPVLWVAYDKGCEDTTCAYGFVLTELGRYMLYQVPDRKGFQTPNNFRRNKFKRNKLKMTKQRSLAEANEVFAVTRKSGKVLTVDLQIRKDVYRPTRADVERAGGAD